MKNSLFFLSLLIFCVCCCSKNRDSGLKEFSFSDIFNVESIQLATTDSSYVEDVNNFFVDSHGNIYVASSLTGRVIIFDKRGRIIKTVGRKGSGPGEFLQINSLRVDGNGDIHVLGNLRITTFREDGGFKRYFIYGNEHSPMFCITEDGEYILYHTGAKTDRLFSKVDSTGRIVKTWGKVPDEAKNNHIGGLGGLACDEYENLYVVFYYEPKIYKYNTDGDLLQTFGVTPKYFNQQNFSRVRSSNNILEEFKWRMEGTIVEDVFYVKPNLLFLELYQLKNDSNLVFSTVFRFLEIYKGDGRYVGNCRIPDSLNIVTSQDDCLYATISPLFRREQSGLSTGIEQNAPIYRISLKYSFQDYEGKAQK